MSTGTEEQEIITGQPELFPRSKSDVDLALVQEAKQYAHTGKIVMKDAEHIAQVVSDLISGVSQREVARKYRIGRHTLRAVVVELERAGKLAPLKQRVSLKMGHVVEAGVDEAQSLLDAGLVPANVLPILIGVISDKKALLDGEATQIIQHKRDDLTVEKVNAWWDGMKVVEDSPDSRSGAEVQNV